MVSRNRRNNNNSSSSNNNSSSNYSNNQSNLNQRAKDKQRWHLKVRVRRGQILLTCSFKSCHSERRLLIRSNMPSGKGVSIQDVRLRIYQSLVMASVQVVETSVNVTDNSLFRDYSRTIKPHKGQRLLVQIIYRFANL